MRYLIWGYYGFGNLGDDLLLEALSQGIRRQDPMAELLVRCFNPPAVAGVTPFPLERLGGWKPLRAWRYLQQLWQVSGRIDVLVIGGGTLFIDKGRASTSLLLLAILVRLARWRGCRVVIVGAGIDILTHPRSLQHARTILRLAHHVSLRDDYSLQFARYIVPAERLSRVADLVFALPAPLPRQAQPRHTVAISLIDYYRTLFPDAAARQQFLQRWVDLCDELLQQGYALTFVALQRGIGECDYELAEGIVARLQCQDACRIVHVESAAALEQALADSTVLLAMRFHAMVLAARQGCPFWGLDTEMKIGMFCREFDMPSMTIETWLAEGLGAAQVAAISQRSIAVERLQQQAIRAERNFERVRG